LFFFFLFYFFFFFQAEDGIRDLYVTGVQTCALPISPDIFRRKARYSAHCEHDISQHGPAIHGGARVDCTDHREETEEAVYCGWGEQELSVESPDGGEDGAGDIAWLAGVDDFGQFRHPDDGAAGKLE